jgi:predicted O-methyltransferase YrrM
MRISLEDLIATRTVPGGNGILAHREKTILRSIEIIRERRPKVIVETGTQSNMLVYAHGISTLIWAALADEVGAVFYSVDINGENIEKGKKITEGYDVNYVCCDSVEFLKTFDRKIGFLYLDSYDFNEGSEAASREHQSREIQAAWPRLSPDACVLLDDCNVQMWFNNELDRIDVQGKSYLAHRYLISKKAKVIYDFPKYQRLYLR